MANQGRQCPKHSVKRQSASSPVRQQIDSRMEHPYTMNMPFNQNQGYSSNGGSQYVTGGAPPQYMPTQGYRANDMVPQYNNYETVDNNGQIFEQPKPCKPQGGPPLNVVVRVQQEGKVPQAKGEIVWSSSSPNKPTCTQIKNLDNWTGEESFTVGGICNDQQCIESQQNTMLRLQAEMEAESVNQAEQISNQQRGIGQNCLDMQTTQRFRAGGGGPCCGGGSGVNPAQNPPSRQSSKNERTPSLSRNPKGGSGSYNQGNDCGACSQAGGSQPYGQNEEGRLPSRTKTTSNISSGSQNSKDEKSSNLEKFTFSTPDSLRLKLTEYIHNKPADGKKFSGKLKPFRGFREDVIACKTCFDTSADTAPAACMPCGRLELTAEDFAREEMQAGKRMKGKGEAEAREQAMAELERYKQIMPADFTSDEQLEYIKCMGASTKAICLMKELQRAGEGSESCGGMQKSQSGSCGGMQKSQSGCKTSQGNNQGNPCGEEESSQNPQDDIQELIRQCREQLDETKRTHEGASQETNLSPSADCYTKNSVDDDVKLFQMLAQKNAKRLSQIEEQQSRLENSCCEPPPEGCCPPSFSCPSTACKPECCIEEEEIMEDEMNADATHEENMKLLQLPMFGPPKQKTEENLADAMELYRVHLTNIRKRYFGEVIKLIDEVENITPEIAAAMVYSEEEGFKMTDAPLKLYEYLYPESPSQPLVTIGDVTGNLPEGIDDIVVPLVPPMFLHAADFPGLEDPAMLDPPRIIQIGPSPNLAEDPTVTETKKAEDVSQLVTGVADQMEDEFDLDEEDEDDEENQKGANVFNIKLQSSMPPHYSRMQMRGSQAPNWFPGYYFAYHSRPGVIMQGTHGSVLEQVWQDVQPDAVRPAGGAVIIGE